MSQVFYDLTPQHEPLLQTMRDAVARVMTRGAFILGPEVEAFESEFAAYCGTSHCVGCSNGLDALQLILRAGGIGSGDEVIVPAHTFVATWMAVSAVGATPVGADCHADTCNVSAAAVEAAITPRTRAVIAVHLYGRPADMAALRRIADRHALLLIEDAAQAHGASIDGIKAGALGDAAAFSFYPSKNLGALGDAGAVVTDNGNLAARVRRIGNYGSERKYQHDSLGLNTRLDELQAALLRVKLPQLDCWNAERQAIAHRYDAWLASCPAVQRPPLADAAGGTPVWHLYAIQSARRDALRDGLQAEGIQTTIHYPIPPHRQGAYAGRREDFPIADWICARVLSLPLYPGLGEAEQRRIAETVCRIAAD